MRDAYAMILAMFLSFHLVAQTPETYPQKRERLREAVVAAAIAETKAEKDAESFATHPVRRMSYVPASEMADRVASAHQARVDAVEAYTEFRDGTP